jgi:hypothetical protein
LRAQQRRPIEHTIRVLEYLLERAS